MIIADPDTIRKRPSLPRTWSLCVAVSLATLLCMGGTAFADGYAKTVRSFLELREDNVVRQEFDISCGAAALATILTYQHNDPVPERVIAKAMLNSTDSELVRQRLGFSLLDLKRFVDARGYSGEGYGEMTLPDLIEMAPAIVPVRLSTFDHFVVFRGIARGRVVFADPGYGNRTMMVDAFLAAWNSRIAFVVNNVDGRPVHNRLVVTERTPLPVTGGDLRAVLP